MSVQGAGDSLGACSSFSGEVTVEAVLFSADKVNPYPGVI